MFGSEKNNSEEIGRLWQRLVPLEDHIVSLSSDNQKLQKEIEILQGKVKKPSESKEEVQTAARAVAQYKGKVQRSKEKAEEITVSLEASLNKSNLILQGIQSKSEELDVKITSYTDTFGNCKSLFSEVKQTHEEIIDKVNETTQLLEENSTLPERLDETTSLLDDLNEAESKAQGILRNIASYHSKVRDLRDEILGYEAENEDGETERIEGIKDELESTYSILTQEITKLDHSLVELKSNTKNSYTELLEKSDLEIKSKLNNQENQYSEVYQKIVDLLPAALTTGLSAAYNEKIESEENELKTHSSSFERAIKWLVIISTIPFITDLYLLVFMGKDLVSVIAETPKLILSILPLYFPVLWMAYSSNKKMNLSKRLIEEYTHKGVLSKTFEGLSTQIEELNDDHNSSELRVKLLFNLLHVNSENPGKLISNYKTTDHPLMDALEKSMKLGEAIDKLKNIPGLTKFAAKLEKESTEALKDTNKKATKTIDTVSEIIETQNS